MSVTCSIPGCKGRNSPSKETKLYRVPATAVGSNGMIFNLTDKRRNKWFNVLESCGLNEENSSSYRVCSNHFNEGKPAPLFDTKSKDWVPARNLPGSGNVSSVEDENSDKEKPKPKRGRPRKRLSEIPGSSDEGSSVRSKSVGRAKSVGRLKNIEESTENNVESEAPFVFVDIKKIKEGTPVSMRSPPKRITSRAKSVGPRIRSGSGHTTRSFATQTNPNVLPPLQWGKHRFKKLKDPRFESIGVQTEITSNVKSTENDSRQVCLGEMIEFIRKQILDFSLTALGKNFKVKECSLHFQREEEPFDPKDKETNTVVVHQNRLLSSNWPLLESVAMSLDLHRLEMKNELTSSGLMKTLIGKTETIEKKTVGDVTTNNGDEKVVLAEIVISDDEDAGKKEHNFPELNFSSQSSNIRTFTSPVLPKITSVMSLGEILEDVHPAEKPRRKLTTVSVPSVDCVPTVQRLIPKNTYTTPKRNLLNVSTSPSSTSSLKKTIPRILARKKLSCEGNLEIQGKLGTTRVPRVLLRKLPDSLLLQASQGKSLSIGMLNTALKEVKQTNSSNKTPKVSSPVYLLPKPPVQLDLTGQATSTPMTFKAVKNIPLKLPQTDNVAGYLLLPSAGSTGNPSPIMYVPSVQPVVGKNLQGGVSQMSFEELVKKGLPGVQTVLLPGNIMPGAVGAAGQGASQILPPPLSVSSILPPPLAMLHDQKSVPLKEGTDERPNDTMKVININSEEDLKAVPKEGGVLLRCPYCLKRCKDGLEFINHHKTTGCRGGRNINQVKCERCAQFIQSASTHTCDVPKSSETEVQKKYPDCNVCGRIFARYGYLANHLKTHSEYGIWTEQCSECPKKFANEHILKRHKIEWHSTSANRDTFRCDKCDKECITEKGLKMHVDKVHDNPSKPRKTSNLKIRCKFCRNVFDLGHYRTVHWKECQEKKRQDVEMKEILEREKEKASGVFGKKPTAIRSRFNDDGDSDEFHDKEDNSIEDQLNEMFKEVNLPVKEEQELKVKDELIENNKNIREKRKKRFMNLDSSESEEDLPVVKISKKTGEEMKNHEEVSAVTQLNEPLELPNQRNLPENEDKIVLNNGLSEEKVEINSKKFDFNCLLQVEDGGNDISIEEMEDDEYFSS